MAAEKNDAFRPEALRRNDATEGHRPVTHDGDDLAGAYLRNNRRVMAGSFHDVGERQERRHQGIVCPGREGEQCSIRIRNANGFGLGTLVPIVAEEPKVYARGWQTFVAKDAGTVGNCKRHDDHIATPHGAYLGADRFDHADRLVPHSLTLIGRLHRPIGPQVAATDARPGNPDHRISGLDNGGVRNVFYPDIAGRMHHCCAHIFYLIRLLMQRCCIHQLATFSIQSTTLPSSAS